MITQDPVNLWLQAQVKPNLIYHYCPINSFLQIVERQTVNMCDVSHANDFFEKKWLQNQVIPQVIARANTSRNRQAWLAELERLSKWGATLTRLYISCFSAHADSLSQWRAYAEDGTGFAVGFDTTKIQVKVGIPINFAGVPVPGLAPVIYDSGQQGRLVENIVNSCVQSIESVPGIANGELHLAISSCADLLRRMSLICKNPAFAEEAEWRMLYTPVIDDNCNTSATLEFGVREVKRGINTLFKWEFPKDSLAQVIMGPATRTHPDDIRLLLKRCGYGANIPVNVSKASYQL